MILYLDNLYNWLEIQKYHDHFVDVWYKFIVNSVIFLMFSAW